MRSHKSPVSASAITLIVAVLASLGEAQTPQHARHHPSSRAAGLQTNRQAVASAEVCGRVTNARGDGIEGSEVEAVLQGTSGAALHIGAVTDIHGNFQVRFPDHPAPSRPWELDLVASSDGYLDASDSINLEGAASSDSLDLVLQREVHDPRLMSPEDLTTLFLPALEKPASLAGDEALHYTLGIRLLDRDNAADAARVIMNVAAARPSCIECLTLSGLIKLQCGGWSSASLALTRAARLAAESTGSDHRAEPFIALGELQTWKAEYSRASISYLQALAIDPQNPLALQELGRSLLLQGKANIADRYLQRALAHGATSEAHLLRAQALVDLNQPEKATEEISLCLGKRKPKDLSPGLRTLWSELVERINLESAGGGTTVVQRGPSELADAIPELRGVELAASQVSLEPILRKVGDAVRAVFQNFPKTTSDEEIEMEMLRSDGKLAASAKQECHYLLVDSTDENSFHLIEYRTDKSGLHVALVSPEARFMVTSGFASDPLIFHPDYQKGSDFRLIGSEVLNGRNTWVIGFAERPARAEVLEDFRVDQTDRVVLIQGIAWADAATYEILRMRTDLLKPEPALRLDAQTTDVRYGEVRFAAGGPPLWLPTEVAVTVRWNGKIFRNRHRYTNYAQFQVNTHEKLKPVRVDALTDQK